MTLTLHTFIWLAPIVASAAGHIGLTDFRSAKTVSEDEAEAERLTSGQEVISFSQDKEGPVQEVSGHCTLGSGPKGHAYNPDRFRMYWCNDTPGVVNPQQVTQHFF